MWWRRKRRETEELTEAIDRLNETIKEGVSQILEALEEHKPPKNMLKTYLKGEDHGRG